MPINVSYEATGGKSTEIEEVLSSLIEELEYLSRSVVYELENEAYRNLPPFLKEKHDVEVGSQIGFSRRWQMPYRRRELPNCCWSRSNCQNLTPWERGRGLG